MSELEPKKETLRLRKDPKPDTVTVAEPETSVDPLVEEATPEPMEEEEPPQLPLDREGKELPEALIRRSAARLAAVQLLYQCEISGKELKIESLLKGYGEQLLDNHNSPIAEEALEINPDMKFLKFLLDGVASRVSTLDTLYQSFLSDNWAPERLNPVLRAVFRLGVLELMEEKSTPPRVIVNEYVDVVHAFCEEQDIGFANAVLDKLALSLRYDEMTGAN